MWLINELQYLQELISEKLRRLLQLLSSTTCKARTEIAALLQKFYRILFKETPTQVYKAMVEFNTWLMKMLVDAHMEKSNKPSYGEDSWLAVEEQPRQSQTLRATPAFDNASTIQLLRASCEYYMVRCDRLETTNADLQTQVVELKVQLKEAVMRAFESQQALDREREVSTLQARRLVIHPLFTKTTARQNWNNEHPVTVQQQITSAFSTLDTISKVPQTRTEGTAADELNQASNMERSRDDDDDASAERKNTEVKATTLHKLEESLLSLSSDNMQEGQETFEVSTGHHHSEPATFSDDICKSIAISSDSDYEQLTKLRKDETKDGGWYRVALRTLKEARRRRSKPRATIEPPFATQFTVRAVCKEAEAQDFAQLDFTRDPARDDEKSVWYRKALHRLK